VVPGSWRQCAVLEREREEAIQSADDSARELLTVRAELLAAEEELSELRGNSREQSIVGDLTNAMATLAEKDLEIAALKAGKADG